MQIYDSYSTSYYRKKESYKNLLPLIPLTFILVVLGALFHRFRSPAPITPLSAQAAIHPVPTSKKIAVTAKNPAELKLKIKDALDDSIPEYSIVVDDFLSDFTVDLGEPSVYVGASIHKLAILSALYYLVQNGTLSFDQEVRFDEVDRQDYGTGTLRYERAGGMYTLHELSEVMIKQSDNTAAYILANRVMNMRDIQTTINNFGLTETSMADNVTTNKDMNLLMRKLFTGQLFNATLTRDAISLLLGSDFEDRLPALLPNNVRVYHKIGTAIAGLHDVGVVVTPTSMYYIGIFTRGVSEEERATKAMARVSRAVYEFMEER